MEYLLLLTGLVMILGGANLLTDGSSAVAKLFRVPEFIIGLTIVAIGTSTPELVVSIISALNDQSSIAIGNVVGSNIFNVLMILGICAIIKPQPLTQGNIRRDVPFAMGAALLLLIFTGGSLIGIGQSDSISRIEGIILLACYVGIIYYSISKSKRTEAQADQKMKYSIWVYALMIVGGLLALIFGGDLFLSNATKIARAAGVSDSVIAITLVAGGTSLPELAASLVSILKGRNELALGNVVGSNIANILLVLGASATISPLTMGSITHIDIAMVVLSSLLIFTSAFTFKRKEIDRKEGVIFIAIYVSYMIYLFS